MMGSAGHVNPLIAQSALDMHKEERFKDIPHVDRHVSAARKNGFPRAIHNHQDQEKRTASLLPAVNSKQ